MSLRQRIILPAITISIFLLNSCEKNSDAVGAGNVQNDPATNAAYSVMEETFAAPGSIETKNFAAAETLFQTALRVQPANPTANFGAAFTRVLGAFNDTGITNTLRRWDGNTAVSGSPFLKFGIPASPAQELQPLALQGTEMVRALQTWYQFPVMLSQMQSMLRNRLLPRIDYAIARLAIVEQHPEFELVLSGKMQGNNGAKPVVLDLTEVYLMDAMLHGIKAQIEQFLIFRYDIADGTAASVAEALRQQNTSFFVRAADGSARGLAAKNSLTVMVDKVGNAVDFLNAEQDDQSDDIIKKKNAASLQLVLDSFNRLKASLNGTFTVSVPIRYPDSTPTTVNLNLGALLTNIPEYPKMAWFPSYTVEATPSGAIHWKWSAQDAASFNFPDPTFGGFLTGMTNTQLKRLLLIDYFFSWRLEVRTADNYEPVPNTAVTVTVDGKSFQPYERRSYADLFLITEGKGKTPVIAVTRNGQSVALEYLTVGPTVKIGATEMMVIDLTVSSKNITGRYDSVQHAAVIDLKNYANYGIERSSNGGAFTSLTSSFYGQMYTDLTVLAGTTYQYRAKRAMNWYNMDYLAVPVNNYTNTVSVTRP